VFLNRVVDRLPFVTEYSLEGEICGISLEFVRFGLGFRGMNAPAPSESWCDNDAYQQISLPDLVNPLDCRN
jgi:hypothetical protein